MFYIFNMLAKRIQKIGRMKFLGISRFQILKGRTVHSNSTGELESTFFFTWLIRFKNFVSHAQREKSRLSKEN